MTGCLLDSFESCLEESIWKESNYENEMKMNENEWKREDEVEIPEEVHTKQ